MHSFNNWKRYEPLLFVSRPFIINNIFLLLVCTCHSTVCLFIYLWNLCLIICLLVCPSTRVCPVCMIDYQLKSVISGWFLICSFFMISFLFILLLIAMLHCLIHLFLPFIHLFLASIWPSSLIPSIPPSIHSFLPFFLSSFIHSLIHLSIHSLIFC